jgi:CubicO group peptidase (beta-lactamase class C family)
MKQSAFVVSVFAGLLLVLVGWFHSRTAFAAALPGDAAIRALLAERINSNRNVGIVVGIVSPEGRRFIAYGRVNRETSVSPDKDTVFEIGSVTKVFTSALLAGMVRKGDVKLTDAVTQYLPPAASSGSKPARAITLADLATHTSGLPFWPSSLPANRDGVSAMATYTEDELFKWFSTFDVPADVGTKWAYSNIDAGLLGIALGRRANRTYDALLKERITGPLDMTSTALVPSPDLKARAAAGYDAELKSAASWNVPALAAAGSLFSSADDLLTFMDAMGNSRPPFEGVLVTMLETQRPGPGIPQALGWMIVATGPGDKGIVTHDGGTLGFTSALAYDPNTKTGVVVLSNTANGVGDIARHLLRPAIPLTTPPPAGPAPKKTEVSIDPSLMDRYAGVYEPGPGVAFTVTREGDALMIQLPGIPKLRLRPESDRDFFVAENTRVTVSFQVTAGGAVQGLLLKSPTGDTTAARTGSR